MYTFIYCLKDPDTKEIRYIGKADDLEVRLSRHVRRARKTTRPKKNAWIRGILKRGEVPLIVPLAQVPFDRWQEFEKQFIAHYKNAGYNLLNETEGGTGGDTGNREYSLEERTAISKRMKEHWRDNDKLRGEYSKACTERWADPETRERFIRAQNTPTVREKRRKSQLKRWENEDELARQSKVGKRNWQDPELAQLMTDVATERWNIPGYRDRVSKSMKKAWEKRPRIVSEESRNRMSIASKKRWDNPEYRKKVLAAQEKAREKSEGISEETRAKLSANSKKMWKTRSRTHTEEQKKKNSETTKRLWDDPEYRAKQMASRKRRWEKYHAEKDKA